MKLMSAKYLNQINHIFYHLTANTSFQLDIQPWFHHTKILQYYILNDLSAKMTYWHSTKEKLKNGRIIFTKDISIPIELLMWKVL